MQVIEADDAVVNDREMQVIEADDAVVNDRKMQVIEADDAVVNDREMAEAVAEAGDDSVVNAPTRRAR